jgi:hypothetical protein
MRTVIEICQPERVSKACSIAGKISGVTSTNTPIPALHDHRPPSPFELVNSLHIRIQETRRLDAEVGQILAEVESCGVRRRPSGTAPPSRSSKTSPTSLTHAAAKKPLDRARAHPTRSTDLRSPPAPSPGQRRRRAPSGPGKIDAIITTSKAIPTTMSEHDRTGAEKTLVDLARDAGPRESGHAGTRPPDTLNPDGPEPKDPARPNPHF